MLTGGAIGVGLGGLAGLVGAILLAPETGGASLVLPLMGAGAVSGGLLGGGAGALAGDIQDNALGLALAAAGVLTVIYVYHQI